PTYAQPVEFKGVPNNGNITSSQAVTAGKYYLIGNPYPSALDAREFLYSNANNNAVLNGTIYFWTHNTGISPSGGKYVYSSNDYASFNATGGTATTGANNAIPSGYIAAGQSFMASAKANGIVEFDNSMRAGGADNAQFFKPGKSSKSTGFESHRLWLNMTNSGGAFKQTLIGYVEGATNSYDVNFDGETFDGNTYIDFYSVNTTNKLTIQGRALPFTNTDLVPLGYRSTIAGDFTISIDKADGNLASQRVYLEDKQTGTINELTAGNYVFTTKAGTFNDRFVLRYSANTLGTGDFEVADDAVWVKIANKTVSVNSTSENIDKVFIYDLSGKQLYVKKDVNNLQLLIENLPSAQQVLLVKVVLDNGYQTTKKVVFN
ncbi:T9SS sorting signal type C domain-containing protein, partial [Flavobacterium salmonis]|uniref:T9SS sorting signal type C domain-containing protein n=1 Tax=Flavobacterium salmonis TaxID=2654844 RepID=UPI00361D3FA2